MVSKKHINFAFSSCRVLFSEESEGVGQLIGIASRYALFFEHLNVGNSNDHKKNFAEVDAAGRYIKTNPLVCRGPIVLRHTLSGALYTNGVSVNSVCFCGRFPTT